MNWEAISASSDFLATVVVIVSLVYISLQVRSGVKSLRTKVRDSAFRLLMDFNNALMSDAELGYIFQKGMHDWDSLNEPDRARALHAMLSFFKLYENAYLHYLDGSIDEDDWINNSRLLYSYTALDGAQYYLKQRMGIFDPRFQQILKNIVATELPAGHIVSKLE